MIFYLKVTIKFLCLLDQIANRSTLNYHMVTFDIKGENSTFIEIRISFQKKLTIIILELLKYSQNLFGIYLLNNVADGAIIYHI